MWQKGRGSCASLLRIERAIMTLVPGSAFDGDYHVEDINFVDEQLVDVFIDASEGAAHGRARMFRVHRAGGTCVVRISAEDPLVHLAVSGSFLTPNPRRLCVIERGAAVLIDVDDVTSWQRIGSLEPIVEVGSFPEAGLLLLVTPWSVVAVDGNGVRWTSRRLSVEGLRLDAADDNGVRCTADPGDEGERVITLDVETGTADLRRPG
jgi:hypothetical protein